MAKVIWNIEKTNSGMTTPLEKVADIESVRDAGEEESWRVPPR
jgi:hypothetical protein